MNECSTNLTGREVCATALPEMLRPTKFLAPALNILQKHALTDTDAVYSYIIETIELRHGNFNLTGSAPNVSGGLITLCTCKHLMRTWSDVGRQGVWIAGLTGINKTARGNALVYLMKVGSVFDSHYDIWRALTDPVRRAKAAHLNPLGDVYQPKKIPLTGDTRFDAGNYLPPHPAHPHSGYSRRTGLPRWSKDIAYADGGRRAALLAGDPDYSFFWPAPAMYYTAGNHPRTKRWDTVHEFLRRLID